MNNAMKWALGILGILLIVITPYFWLFGKMQLLWITCPLIIAWAVWLMLEYLNWVKTLGKK